LSTSSLTLSRYTRISLNFGSTPETFGSARISIQCPCKLPIWPALFSKECVLFMRSITRLRWYGSFSRISANADPIFLYSTVKISSVWSIRYILFCGVMSSDLSRFKSNPHCLYFSFSSDEIPMKFSQKLTPSSMLSANKSS